MGFDADVRPLDFPILSRTFDGKPLVYLDSAATSQKPTAVIEAEADFYRHHNANAHRGIYTLGEEATELFEGARATIAAVLRRRAIPRRSSSPAAPPSRSTSSRSRGAGRTCARATTIVLTEMEHHSNIVPWQLLAKATGAELRYIPLTDDGQLDLSDLDALLTERTKVLAVTAMSNALGTITPLAQLVDAAHAVGAIVVVDAAQAAPHLALDLQALGCGRGGLLRPQDARSDRQRRTATARGRAPRGMEPLFGGGDMIREVFHDHSTWNDVPFRVRGGHDAGRAADRTGGSGSTTCRRSAWTRCVRTSAT